jgi:hypothetical protein
MLAGIFNHTSLAQCSVSREKGVIEDDQTRITIPPTLTTMLVGSVPISAPASPTGVIQASTTSKEYWAGLPNIPRLVAQKEEEDLAALTPTKRKFVDQKARLYRIGPHKKQVSFSPDREEILAIPAHHDHCLTDPYPLGEPIMGLVVVVDHDGPSSLQEERWYSKTELDSFKKLANKSILKFHKTNANTVKAFCNLLAECSSPSSRKRREESVVPKNAQKVLQELESSDMRGLEAYVHRAIRQHRRWHVQNVLAVQAAASSNNEKLSSSTSATTLDSPQESLLRSVSMRSINSATSLDSPQERVLRSVSMRSSRSSKIIARLLGHGDSIRVASMVQEELGRTTPEQRCLVRRAA